MAASTLLLWSVLTTSGVGVYQTARNMKTASKEAAATKKATKTREAELAAESKAKEAAAAKAAVSGKTAGAADVGTTPSFAATRTSFLGFEKEDSGVGRATLFGN